MYWALVRDARSSVLGGKQDSPPMMHELSYPFICAALGFHMGCPKPTSELYHIYRDLSSYLRTLLRRSNLGDVFQKSDDATIKHRRRHDAHHPLLHPRS